MIYAILAFVVIAAISVPFVLARRSFKRGGSAKKALKLHLASFVLTALLCAVAPFAVSAATTPAPDSAAPTAAAQQADETAADGSKAWGYIAAALAVGLSGIGGGIAVAASAPAAIGATSENEKAFSKSLIFVALGEGVALYGLVVSILILFV